MTSDSDFEYRFAAITVCGRFLGCPEYERDDMVRHEILHFPLHPLTDWTKDLIHRLTGEDQRLRDWLLSEWRQRLEGAVVDLENALRSHG